jgi:hypothetical protein
LDSNSFWRHGIRSGVFLWQPAPEAAKITIEQLRRAVIKRQDSTHVFVCPRLLGTEWIRQMYKCADFIVNMRGGVEDSGWPLQMYELLTITIVFPLLRVQPWRQAETPKMFGIARKLYSVWKEPGMDTSNLLSKFLEEQWSLSGVLSESMVRKSLFYESRGDVLHKD